MQVSLGHQGAGGLGDDLAGLIVFCFPVLIGIDGGAVRGGEGGGGLHARGEGPGVVKDDDRLEVNGSLGGYVVDLVDGFHRSGEVGHYRGDGDID